MTGTYPRTPYVGGLGKTEAAVMDLWDNGKGIPAIAAALNLAHERVQTIVIQYHIEPNRAPAEAAKGSTALLAAIQRHHPAQRKAA